MREKSSDLKCFRERTDELMSQLDKHDIPVLILSAGLGDLIHEVLAQYKVIFFLDSFLTILVPLCMPGTSDSGN